ncbi:kinase domain protein (macronuclear) [Tetrahymena thermophila SB210]|uniref:Kinase domain protein n=1 Tax=Tetrahymena thermophila (strain SB210) TaxID=312017 RepID=Q23BT0_TETTS|nr:kinase domain protein [Tetrahymena thermophila SB210]EAR94038.3 kinase domain protein [Tetrahymena thermophila SB210]|eukprot:XP_001014283.3 kinase domain protein [Tetrahymena thermophila SB210]
MKKDNFKTVDSQRNIEIIKKKDFDSLFNRQQDQLQVQQEIQNQEEKQSQSHSHFEKYQMNSQINNNQNMVANDECETLLKSQLCKKKLNFTNQKLNQVAKEYRLDQQNSQNNSKTEEISIIYESRENYKIEFQDFQNPRWNQENIQNNSKNEKSSIQYESSEIKKLELICISTQKNIDTNETSNNNMSYQNSHSYNQNLNEFSSKDCEQSDQTIQIKQQKANEKLSKYKQIQNYKNLSNKIQAKQYLSQVSQNFEENNYQNFETLSDNVIEIIDNQLTEKGYEDIKYKKVIGCGFVQKATKQIGQDKKHYLILILTRFIKIQNSHKNLELLKFLKTLHETKQQIQIDDTFQLYLNGCQHPIYSVIALRGYSNTYNFLLYIEKIIDFFKKNEYYLEKYIAEGGFGIVFDGKIYQNNKIQEVIFKIQFTDEQNTNESEEEFLIMKGFEKNINLINAIDYKKIDQNVSVILMEKCECNLNNKLKQLQERNQFSFTQLLKIIFDLIDGLILLRIYKIIHLDIKPTNILINRYGIYVFSDFGISIKNKNNIPIKVKGFTPSYAPEEVIKGKVSDINYESDVFSLGKTLEIVFKEYEKLKIFNQNEKAMLEKFKQILKDYALREQVSERKTCLELHKAFYEVVKFGENKEFSQSYIDKIRLILLQTYHDSNKDIQFFHEVSIYYNEKILDLKQNIKKSHILSFVEIESLSESSLRKIDKILSQEDPEYILIYHSIASFYNERSQFEMEKKYLQKSLELCNQLFKKENIYLARTFNKLALFHLKQEGLEKSLKSLKILENIFKGDHDTKAIFLNTLSWCYSSLQESQKALEVQEKSLKMRMNLFSQNHTRIAVALNNLGTMYQKIDQIKSLEYQLLSLQIRQFLFQENHPCIARSLDCVGQCYLNMGNLKKAKKYLYRSYFMRRRIYKGDIDCVADSLKSIARYYQKSGEFIKAIFFYKKYFQMIRNLKSDIKYVKDATLISKRQLIIGLCQFNIGQFIKNLQTNIS